MMPPPVSVPAPPSALAAFMYRWYGAASAWASSLVALEILKELPATMLLQPFQLKTLAVSLHQEVQQESLSGAAAPALVLVAAGLFAITLTTVIHFGREQRQ